MRYSFLIMMFFILTLCYADGNDKMNNTDSIFLCGDVMTGRGVDQIMAFPSIPVLYESFMKDARGYVRIAEQKNGLINKPVPFEYIWGDALNEFNKFSPDARIINLETAITESGNYWKGKGINYRMHPLNIPCLTSAKIDLCTLANNHVLDWGYDGLSETLNSLREHEIQFVGAGFNTAQASAPGIVNISADKRILLYGCCLNSSGVPLSWRAGDAQPGVNLLQDLSDKTLSDIVHKINDYRRAGDIVIFSIHWGDNWGYDIPRQHIQFAHKLIDSAAVDIIHGHSSHHFLAFEVYKNKPVFYGCGDLITDYEGISGHEVFRPNLSLLYFISFSDQNQLKKIQMVPMKLKQFRLKRAANDEIEWIKNTLNREGKKFGTQVTTTDENIIEYEKY